MCVCLCACVHDERACVCAGHIFPDVEISDIPLQKTWTASELPVGGLMVMMSEERHKSTFGL